MYNNSNGVSFPCIGLCRICGPTYITWNDVVFVFSECTVIVRNQTYVHEAIKQQDQDNL